MTSFGTFKRDEDNRCHVFNPLEWIVSIPFGLVVGALHFVVIEQVFVFIRMGIHELPIWSANGRVVIRFLCFVIGVVLFKEYSIRTNTQADEYLILLIVGVFMVSKVLF